MGETSKRHASRQASGWFERYLVGEGIDIGCGDDPVTPTCTPWDLPQGDAQVMAGVPDARFDWVYSSHCLEHMVDPSVALANWWRILKPGGYLIVLVPDEDLYEQQNWPPIFNADHKSTWTIRKARSWSPVSRNLADELRQLPGSEVVSLRLYNTDYNYVYQNRYRVSLQIPDNNLAVAIEAAGELTASMLGDGAMKFLGFNGIDQTSPPFSAEVSLEGIVKKHG